MSWWSDLLQGLQVNPVLRERLALAEQKFKDMETEIKTLTEQVVTLTKENEALKKQIEQTPMATALPKEIPEVVNGLYFFDKDRSKFYCPRCFEVDGKKHIMADTGLGHECTVCEKFIHR